MKISYVLLGFLLFANAGFSQSSKITKKSNTAQKKEVQDILNTPSCLELVRYRDKELYQEYMEAANNYTNKYQITKQALIDLQKNREEVLSGNASWWQMSAETATTEVGLVTGVVAKGIQTSCRLIANILKFDPATGAVGGAIEEGSLIAERVFASIEAGEKIHYIVNEGAEKAAYKEVLSIAGPLGQAVKTAWDLAEDIAEMKEMPEDRDKLKEEITRVLDMIDLQVKKYQQTLITISDKLNNEKEILKGINDYLAKKCNYVSAETKKDSRKTVDRGSSTSNNTDKTSKKNMVDKGFYVFLTTEIHVNNKIGNIISQPVSYNGNPADMMIGDKAAFIDQIRKQIPNSQDAKTGLLTKDNYAAIKIHYGKPYSTKSLQTKGDVSEAIEAYKNSLREATEGLGGDPLEFIQINEQ